MNLPEIRKAVIAYTKADPLFRSKKPKYVKARVIFNEIAKKYYERKEISSYLGIDRSVVCHYNDLTFEPNYLSKADFEFCNSGYNKYRVFNFTRPIRNGSWNRICTIQ